MADELEALRIRDEVLQAMFWMCGEGLSDAPTAADLARFIALPVDELTPYLDRFAADGYIERVGDGYTMTTSGSEIGKRGFADEFAGLTGQAHGECDDDCWCHESPDEAARCLEERLERAR